MLKTDETRLLFALTSALTLAAATQATAQDLSACNRFDFTSGASCEVRVEGGCDGYCEPPRLEAACAADLYVNCEGQCDASFDAECAVDCEADCNAECEVMPPEFDCFAYCQADCDASCEASCEAGEGGSECRASCRATCSGECDASCTRTPGSADCSAKCEASCQGGCTAEANIDCQASCQADGYVMCKADLTGGCEVQCEKPEGALFCDGQYVNTGDIDACIAALRDSLDIDIQAEGDASLTCENGQCDAIAEGSVGGCSAAPSSLPSTGGLLLTLLASTVLLPLRKRS